MCLDKNMSNTIPPLPSIEHLLTLEQECSELSVEDYNAFARRVRGGKEEKETVVERKRKS